ncbi:MAG: Flp pilus assembly protein CpaB [Deltaproteobacteria bacterium]|nr:Flp pilus assembly protein CpaB [Deltaproteobacteria bacterium]
MKIKQPAWIAAAAGVLALLLSFGYFRVKEARLNALEDPVTVVVAKKDVLQASRLDPSQLTLMKFPRRFVQPAAALSLESVAGQVAMTPILKGEQIVMTKLLPLGEKSGLQSKIPLGMRALSVEMDDVSGVAGLIRPNNFIDLLATFEMEDSTENLQVGTHTIAQKVLVLAVGREIQNGLDGKKQKDSKNMFGGASFTESLTGNNKRTLTLALTPQQAQEVEFAKQQGVVAFSLRPQWEEEPLNLQPTTALDLVGFKGRAKRTGYREYRGK